MAVNSSESPSVVSFEGIGKSYGSVDAVRGLSFDISRGETVALLGPNGAGKSTSLEILLGLRRPDRGNVRLFGRSPGVAIRAGYVGAMLQSGGLMPEVSVRSILQLFHNVGRHPRPIDEVMRESDIEDIAGRRVDRLSGGQLQRVRFAIAIIDNPDLIVLDEPTAGMDVATRKAFWARMRSQAEAGKTLIFATHYMEEVDGAADRVLVIHKGRLLADTTPAELKARSGIRHIGFRHRDPQAGVGAEALRGLPGVVDVQLWQDQVRLRSMDSDATLEALYLGGVRPRDLEVRGIGLEESYLALTAGDGDTNEASTDEPLKEAVR